MSRDHSIQKYEARNPSTSTAGTVTSYFSVGSRPILVKKHLLTGINPSDTDGDTIRCIWDYSVTGAGGATWVVINDTTNVREYNDTDDYFALGDIGDSTASTVSVSATGTVVSDDSDLFSGAGIRVPALALIRHREVTAGTITTVQLNSVIEYIVL